MYPRSQGPQRVLEFNALELSYDMALPTMAYAAYIQNGNVDSKAQILCIFLL